MNSETLRHLYCKQRFCKQLLWPVFAGLILAPLVHAGIEDGIVDQNQQGDKFSPLKQIHRGNVKNLQVAWEYHTGDLPPDKPGLTSFQDQPSLIEGNLVVCTIKRRLIALDPATGEERWTYDPQSPFTATNKCRGVGNWIDHQADADEKCRSRIFLSTSDYKLHAIDARTGQRCQDFGDQGIVSMPISKATLWEGEVEATSNPAVVNNVVVVGSSVADLQRVDAPSGRVLAFDARSGKLLWEFDPVPRNPDDPAMATWAKGTEGFGQGNVWSSMAVDQQLDLVYLPTTSVSDDYYGGNRPGNNEYGTSVVAIRGSTGEVIWHQQLVHHNLWDYDIPSQPMLIDYPHNGKMVPALVQNTKMGMIFVFDRATGEPLVPMEERAVPQSGALAGEVLSPTQPFPVGMPHLAPQNFTPDDVWGFTFIDKWLCKKKASTYNYGPIYTPITEKGTIVTPPVGGGPNWGGGAYDPQNQLMVVPSNRVPIAIRLIPREKAGSIEGMEIESKASMRFVNRGSPYAVSFEPLLSPLGAPCTKPPWAALTAVDIVKKKIIWEVPLGSLKKLLPIPIDWQLGTPGAGGPLATAGGLVFIGYTLDDTLRAFDLDTGEILWEADLPAAGTAVPVTYEVNGEQFIVIAAGGHSVYGSTMGDSVVAFKLKR